MTSQANSPPSDIPDPQFVRQELARALDRAERLKRLLEASERAHADQPREAALNPTAR